GSTEATEQQTGASPSISRPKRLRKRASRKKKPETLRPRHVPSLPRARSEGPHHARRRPGLLWAKTADEGSDKTGGREGGGCDGEEEGGGAAPRARAVVAEGGGRGAAPRGGRVGLVVGEGGGRRQRHDGRAGGVSVQRRRPARGLACGASTSPRHVRLLQ